MEDKNSDLLETIERLRKIEDLTHNFMVWAVSELRTPIATILGYSQILTISKSTLTDEQRESLIFQIQKDSQTLHQRMDELIEATKVQSGWIELEIQEVDLEQLLKRLKMTITEYIETLKPGPHENLYPTVEFKIPDVLPLIRTDSSRMEHILLDLLVRVVGRRNRKGGEIIFSVECDNEWVKIETVDNGVGAVEYSTLHLGDLAPTTQHFVESQGGYLELQNYLTKGGWGVSFNFPISWEVSD